MEDFHVAVFPSGGTGHINPMLELSRRLVDEGLKVSFLLPENKIPSSQEKQGIRFVSLPSTNGPIFNTPAYKDPVLTALEALQPPSKCLIADAFIGWSQDVANSLGIPRVAVWCANTFSEAVTFSGMDIISGGYVPVKEDDERLISFIPGLPPIKPRQLPLAFHIEDSGIRPLAEAMLRLKEAVCVVTNAVEELEQEAVNGRRTVFRSYFPVGPLIPAAVLQGGGGSKRLEFSEAELRCMTWLEKQAPQSVLYIAFGSVVTLSAEQVEKMVEALIGSGVPFLWAIRRNFVSDAAEGFYESLETRGGCQGLFVDWAPQVQVLQHASVRAFFMHCGWNSTLEALCCGVPTICWPLHAEQNLNCYSMVEVWKMGMKAGEKAEDKVTKEEIEKVILAVMEGEEGMEMKRMVDALKATVLAGGCSRKNLKEFILKLIESSCNK